MNCTGDARKSEWPSCLNRKTEKIPILDHKSRPKGRDFRCSLIDTLEGAQNRTRPSYLIEAEAPLFSGFVGN